jgi:hypothetical protein
VNATRGGMLEVLPRVQLDDVLGKSPTCARSSYATKH